MSKKSTAKKIGPTDPDFILEDYVLYNLIRASSTYTTEMDQALKSYGLDNTKWRVLSLLKDKSPSTVSELARRSVIKLPTLTRMLIRMENEGLITRQALDNDRRVVEVRMTSSAKKTLTLVRSIGHKVFDRAFDGIEAQEVARMTKTLKRMRENLNLSPYETHEDLMPERKAKI